MHACISVLRVRTKAIKDHFVKKPENPREFWNAYRPFLHGKTKQANDTIIKENNAIINDEKEIAELFNANFIQITESVPLMKKTDYETTQALELFMRSTGQQMHCFVLILITLIKRK